MADTLQLWVGALLTLMIFSFLYKDNPFYKFAEHLFVGVSAAYWMVTAFWNTIVPNLIGKIAPPLIAPFAPQLAKEPADPIFWIPLVFSFLLLARLVPKFDYLSRWAVALIVGWTAGTNMMRYMQSDFVGQIHSTIVPLIVLDPNGGFLFQETFSNIVLVVGVLCGLVYFFFSKEHTGAFGGAARVGIWFLMVTFGAAFGYTVMARISLLIGRMEYLGRWLSNPLGGG